jgi:hypothetical protein
MSLNIIFELEKISTFTELYEFLQFHYNKDSIIDWLHEVEDKSSFTGEKQESTLRLFAGLGLIDKLREYDICKGNFNQKTITKISSFRDIFHNDDNTEKKLKDKGDSSDLTGIHKNDEKNILVCSSKNRSVSGKLSISGLDIDKLNTNIQQYVEKGCSVRFCLCIDDINNYERMLKNVNRTSNQTVELIDKPDTIIVDWNDLDQAYRQFKHIYQDVCIKDLISNKKSISSSILLPITIILTCDSLYD